MRKITIDVLEIKNRKDLVDLLDLEMQFEGWYGPKLDDWIEMISVFEAGNPNGIPSRFHSSEEELFILEVQNASNMMLSKGKNGLFQQMILIFKKVNEAYMAQFNRPILGLSLL